MSPNHENRAAEVARGLFIKRKNAVTAVCAGAALGVIAAQVCDRGPSRFGSLVFACGFLCGIVYANAFEYVLHRFLLHWGQGFLVQRHALHHNSVGQDDEARYVNFASSSWVVVFLFVANAAPAFALLFLTERWIRALPWGIWGAGIFSAFTLYYVFYEEIHWRIHMGGWLPSWLGFSRRHHMLHHGDFPGHYNVFLPLFDWLFGCLQRKTEAPVSR